MIRAMEPHGLWFAEAPVKPEDLDGLAHVAGPRLDARSRPARSGARCYDLVPRVARRACAIVQPEMGHTGVTEFMRIGLYAQAHHLRVIPHATIGIGIFLAASLHASSRACRRSTCHEFQHSIFEPNRRLLIGDMDCRDGAYTLPTGPGLGVEPSEEALEPSPRTLTKTIVRNRRRIRHVERQTVHSVTTAAAVAPVRRRSHPGPPGPRARS